MDYSFAPFAFSFFVLFCVCVCVFFCKVEQKVSFSLYFLRCNWWVNCPSIKQKIQTMKRQFLVKNFDDLLQAKRKNFRINPYDNLKMCMSLYNYSGFQLLSEWTFSLRLSLLLNKSIRWLWLLFDLNKAREKRKQVIKFGWQLIIKMTSKSIQKMLLNIAFQLMLAEVTFKSFSFWWLQKGSLQFFARVSTTMSSGPRTLSRTCFIDI